MVNHFLEHRGVSEEILLDHLSEKFHKFIDVLVEGNKEKIERMTEKNFGEKLIENLESFKKNDITFVRNSNSEV